MTKGGERAKNAILTIFNNESTHTNTHSAPPAALNAAGATNTLHPHTHCTHTHIYVAAIYLRTRGIRSIHCGCVTLTVTAQSAPASAASPAST